MPVCQADAEAGDPGCSPAVGQAGGAGALGVAGTGPTSAKPGCSEHVYNMSSITHVVCHPMGGLGRRQDAGRKKEAKRGKSGHHGGVRSGGRCRGNSHLLAEGWAREWACQRGSGGCRSGQARPLLQVVWDLLGLGFAKIPPGPPPGHGSAGQVSLPQGWDGKRSRDCAQHPGDTRILPSVSPM